MQDKTIHIFLSYTRREAEVQRLQMVTDAYCDLLVRWARMHGVEIFYDKSSIPQNVACSDEQLTSILRTAVRRSHLLVSLLSPEYIDSHWCRFEYGTKWSDAPREIHHIYWKPKIELPLFPWLARMFRPARTRFLMTILDWNRIRAGDRGHWRDTRLEEWLLVDDPDRPSNFSDVTDAYARGAWAGIGSVARCAQRSAVILCREHPKLFGGEFRDHSFFVSSL